MSFATSFAASAKAWRCPQCTIRGFATSLPRASIGPEHPQYVPIRQPPQQDVPDRSPVKGHLPVPRDVFNRSEGQDKASKEWINRATPVSQSSQQHQPGTREAWKAEMSKMRRQNMRTGLRVLRHRKTQYESKLRAATSKKQAEREQLLRQPPRRDEVLANPDHGLDLEKLKQANHSNTSDAALREIREHKRRNFEQHAELKEQARLSALNELYLNARTFIVTPEQLDTAIDKAFGTDKEPVVFGQGPTEGLSIWAEGVPQNVQEMLQKVNARNAGKRDYDTEHSLENQRITRIAELLTGSKMTSSEVAEDTSAVKQDPFRR